MICEVKRNARLVVISILEELWNLAAATLGIYSRASSREHGQLFLFEPDIFAELRQRILYYRSDYTSIFS